MKSWTKLLNWYDKNGRDLPWRNTRDPYNILVSEIMLQQTQVSRVLVFYERWLKQFPAWKPLSEATNEDVIRAWAGLGYNRRALMLRDIAREIVKNGEPKSAEEWIRLKGIGPYTSAALGAFALQQRTMPIDTNIRRVLARYLLGVPFPDLKSDHLLAEQIDQILPTRGRYYDVPQAIFDLATLICTKTPDCSQCPMKSSCATADRFIAGQIETPKRMTKNVFETRHREKKYPDRIYRGRILKLVRESAVGIKPMSVGFEIDPHYDQITDEEWVNQMIQRLEKNEILEMRRKRLYLRK